MKKILCLLTAGLAFNPLVVQVAAQEADAPSENWTEVNLALTDNVVIPAYGEFDRAAAQLEAAGTTFCRAPGAGTLDSFRSAYHGAMDAWQQIQHVQFGPITYFNWNYRVQYWPDEKGTGARQLDALIARGDEDALDSESFARESVGVQGFPALEGLLFDEHSLAELGSNPFRCRVAATIARNIAEIASGVHSRWVDEFRTTVANADERGFFESAEDATIDFLKAQVEPVRRIQQQKLEEVIGEAADQARTRRAESWRSARSVRNIRLNVTALETLFNGTDDQPALLRDVFYDEDVESINSAFAGVMAALEPLPDSFDAALAQDAGHARLLDVAGGLDALFEAFEAGLKNTDLYLGFNSLDGD